MVDCAYLTSWQAVAMQYFQLPSYNTFSPAELGLIRKPYRSLLTFIPESQRLLATFMTVFDRLTLMIKNKTKKEPQVYAYNDYSRTQPVN